MADVDVHCWQQQSENYIHLGRVCHWCIALSFCPLHVSVPSISEGRAFPTPSPENDREWNCANTFSLAFLFSGILAGKAFLMVLSSSSANSMNTPLSAHSNSSFAALLVTELLLVSYLVFTPLQGICNNFLHFLHSHVLVSR